MASRINVKVGYVVAAFLVIAVFIADIFTPLGLIVWILYALPLLIVSWSAERRVTYGLAAFCTLLMAANLFMSPRGLPQTFEIFNSSLGIVVLWSIAVLLAQRREDRDALARDKELLEATVRERTAELRKANADLLRSRRRAQGYARRLVEEIENERRTIARELHDEAGQSLTAIMLRLGALEQECRGSDACLAETVQELERMTSDVMEGLHGLSRNLRPASLDRLGLVAALRQHIQSFEQQAGIPVTFMPVHLDQDPERLPGEIEICVYRVVQEALTNVARHAHARRVGVVLKRRGQRVIAIVEDDGSGFDVAAAMERGRLGLLGMRERTELLGGRLEIESAAGQGTTIFLDIPVH